MGVAAAARSRSRSLQSCVSDCLVRCLVFYAPRAAAAFGVVEPARPDRPTVVVVVLALRRRVTHIMDGGRTDGGVGDGPGDWGKGREGEGESIDAAGPTAAAAAADKKEFLSPPLSLSPSLPSFSLFP